jgi:glutamyl-tRNA synthetase
MVENIFRLAPTPSGWLHQGNAYNFLLNWLYAKQLDAKVLLRIDDLDAARSRPEYVSAIFTTLDWLGLDWDVGPKDVREFQEYGSQTLRLPNYQLQSEKLIAKGWVFACDCSRRSLQNAGFAGTYPNICMEKNLPLDPNLPWRVRVPTGTTVAVPDAKTGVVTVNLNAEMGSFVIKTRAGIPAYQLASLCDDVQFGITHVIRGQDLLASTAAQLYLAEILDLESFKNVQFYHHPLILDEAGNKLSKSAGSRSLQYWQENNFPVADLLQSFAAWLPLPTKRSIEKIEDLIPLMPSLFVESAR